MLINKIGEFGLIERIKNSIKTDKSVVVGIGDDCAVLSFNKYYYQLFTCDMVVEDVDFEPDTDLYLVGRKALAVSISDIASCSGIPKHAVVSVGLPQGLSVNNADKIIKGIRDLAREYKINIVGGDISKAAKLVVDVCMLGVVEKNRLVLRRNAEIGDCICVSGTLGGSIRGKHLKFQPRLKEARFLTDKFRINSMIDISDGLVQDLSHILSQSNKGGLIYESLIPLSRQAKNLDDALYSGEDFELLFTLPLNEAKRLLPENKAFKLIGEIIDKKSGLKLITDNGKEKKLSVKGFRHF